MTSWTAWTWSGSSDAADLWRLVHQDSGTDVLLVRHEALADAKHAEQLVGRLAEPLAATVSPIPLEWTSSGGVESYELADDLPPAPTLGTMNPSCVAIDVEVLRAVWPDGPSPGSSWPEVAATLGRRIVDRGWRHVGAPGIAFGHGRSYPPTGRDGGWGSATIAEIDGPSNESLATHRLWARTRRGIRLVIDAACLEGGQHNGSQALVASVAEALVAARPDARVSLAVARRNLRAVRAVTTPALEVIERGAEVTTDVLYRPYQLLVPAELPWLTATGDRLLVGQLDMIGFANPSYHPSPTLFHTVRNLQRLTMRLADGVTFISEFGRQHALAECPDLQQDRCFVVSSGASVPPVPPVAAAPARRYVLCLSAVFWHKHRDHAIRTFASMVTDHGYEGDLCIAGPEPLYGRSSEAEATLVESLPRFVRDRIRFLGRVDDAARWTLLAQADLVLYPSVVEGFGMVPFEAASVGTATLVAPGSALGEVFAGTGAVVGTWGVPAWSARAMEIVRSSSHREELVVAIRSCAERHSWENVAAETWRAIDVLLARPRARLHREESGVLAHVASHDIAMSAPAAHFANRLAAYARRRLARPR